MSNHVFPHNLGPADPGHPAATTNRDLDGQWHRLHPLTPWIRGWIVVVALFWAVVHNVNLLRNLSEVPVWAASAAVVAVLALVVGFNYLSWRRTEFRVTHDSVQWHSGILVRNERQARLDRVQAIDVVRPLLARVIGLSELRFDVAGDQSNSLRLAFLSEARADELRNALLARAAGVTYEAGPAPQAPESVVVMVPTTRLIWSILLGPATFAAVPVLIGLIVAGILNPFLWLTMGVPMIGVLAIGWTQFNTNYDFTVASSPDGIRLRHGLLKTESSTVPPGRVQAVSIHQPWLWRKAGWWLIEVNIAGFGMKNSSGEQKIKPLLLPVGTLEEVHRVLWHVYPAEKFDWNQLQAALLQDKAGDFAGPPSSARWLDPLVWQRRGVRLTDHLVLIKDGRLRRKLTVMTHDRAQSWAVTRGPLQRRLRLATVHIHCTPGLQPVIHHQPQDRIVGLLTALREHAHQARGTATPARWMASTSQVSTAPLSPGDVAAPPQHPSP